MSIFCELLPKIKDISTVYINNLNKDLQAALQSFQKFEEEFQTQNGRSKTREKAQKDKNAMITLQSIDESEDESKKDAEPPKATRRSSKSSSAGSRSSGSERLAAKKRSKHEVEGLESPAQDKRQKRNASVKAQSIISKQVNVNLTQKMRRENSEDIQPRQSSRSRRQKEGEKENVAPNLPVQIKQEKVSIPPDPEPMDMESVSLSVPLSVKQETNPDDIAMPPPAVPVPKPRKAVLKEKPAEEPEVESSRRSRRTTRTKKQDAPPPVPAARSTRSSSRVRAEPEPAPEPEARPKRTRGRKKVSEIRPDSGNGTQSSQESLPASPADKPRPKRTRRAQKADKEPKPVEPEPTVSPKEERPSTEQVASPILSSKETKSMRNKKDTTQTIIDLDKTKESTKSNNSDKDSDNTKSIDKNTDIVVKPSAKEKAAKAKQDKELAKEKVDKIFAKSKLEMAKAVLDKETESKSEKDAIIDKSKSKANGLVKGNSVEKLAKSQSVDVADSAVLDDIQLLSKPAEMDQTMVLPNGVYNHAPVTPNNIHLNETVTLAKTLVLDKPNIVMDATVVLEKGPPSNLTADTSLLTDDESQDNEIPATPPRKGAPTEQPASAVKEKVQQFEEMASRVTRTKTRAMAKKKDPKDKSHTPPDKVSKVVLSSDTLSKMNSLIFNGKAPQSTSSACKPRAPAPAAAACKVSASASKASSLSRWREAAAHDDTQAREDARAKKEALLEAKREQQKRKREEKMAAAAAARSAAERERRALQEAAARERAEKQLHADQERGERLKEVERKKQELARKAAETEERRRAEEAARHQRLAEEQRRALEQRRKQLEEQEAMKREEAKMSKEIEKKHREYLEKQKQKLKIDKMHTPFKTPGTPLSKYPTLPPAHMEDGFQYLDSDEDAEPPERPIPTWCSSKVRRARLAVQSMLKPTLVDRLFSVGVHSPDLAEIFPCMERARLKRTSSAVWHTPPPLPPCRE